MRTNQNLYLSFELSWLKHCQQGQDMLHHGGKYTEFKLSSISLLIFDHLNFSLETTYNDGFLQLLLKYFNEEGDQMFHKIDQTTLSSEVNCTKLPSTPCIVVGTFECFYFSVVVTVILLL